MAFIVMTYGLLAALLAAFIFPGVYWYRRVRLGAPEERFDRLARRAWLALRDGVGQGYVVRETRGCMHDYAFYVGFVGLSFGVSRVEQYAWKAKPETLVVGHPFCLTMPEDADKSLSLESHIRVRDLSELEFEATKRVAQQT